MQNRIRNYLKEVAKKKGHTISACLLGIGKTNTAILASLYGCNACREITVRQSGEIYRIPQGDVRLIKGDMAYQGIYEDVIFASPSVRRERLRIPYDSVITSDTEIFFDEPRENVFLVSGSDGKSTVTTIASLLLSPTFSKLFTGGNLGTPTATASLDSDAFLLELSSFNLRYAMPKSKRAVLTGVTPNHLDWHDNLEEYESCKRRLIEYTDEAVIPLCCPFNVKLAKEKRSFALISLTETDRELRLKYDTHHTVSARGGMISVDGEALFPTDCVKRGETHNLVNFMSAVALTLGYATESHVRRIAEDFRGLPHRCEFFSMGNREYINSSIDTTPERSRVTLMSLDRPVSIILGGRGKGLSPEPMKEALIRYAKRISVYGEISKELTEWIESNQKLSEIPHESFNLFRDAIDYADGWSGKSVLLSPAATAYGEFVSFEERGRFFKEYIGSKYRKI